MGQAQPIRLPHETLALASANCMDVSVAFASAAENIGLQPLVVIVPGHALAGVRRRRRAHPRRIPARPAHPGLTRPVGAMPALSVPAGPQRGQSQPNVPAVKNAYTRPSNTDFRVVPQFRLYQIECWSSASE